MKNYYLLLIMFLLSVNNHAQEHKAPPKNDVYISLENYTKKYKTSFEKIDTQLLFIRKKDTLVLDKNYKKPKGVEVLYEYKDSTFLHYYKNLAFNHP
ncbi:MAG: hypothetical protein HRT69_14750 [Flavobacteriaceae bacterium]|nr:hypothetical protein [Flavobacteriaceae bacterium]